MPVFERGDTSINYEVTGSGYPILMFAPGGQRSAMAFWARAPFDPAEALSGEFKVITMDQRNAGQSRGPVDSSDGWDTYAADHLALLEELGVERFHVLGMCIGSSFCLRLAVRFPERVTAAVLEQPIGLSNNRERFHEMFDGWAEELALARPEVTRAALSSFRHNLYDRDFAFSVSRDEVRNCPVPFLVLRGNDVYHPAEVSEEVARIAPRAELIHTWKEGDAIARARDRVRAFLVAQTPR